MNPLISIDASFYFEINLENGKKGYSCINLKDLTNINELDDITNYFVNVMSKLVDVKPENVKLISREEYRLNGGDDSEIEIYNNSTVDAVPVVRCEDCKYYKPVFSLDKEDGMRCIREKYTRETRPIDYCSYGERREEDD